MAAYLLTWNPNKWDGEITSPMGWSCGNTKRIVSGDRLFLMRQVREPRGVCASGWAVSNVIENEPGEYISRRHVNMRIEVFRNPATMPILTREVLNELNRGVERPMKWDSRSSGTKIPPPVAQRLEDAWQQLCGGLRPEELPLGERLIEGARRVVEVNAYERDRDAHDRCIAAHGTNCCVCGFSFGAVYGKVAEGYIEVHHLRPLSEVGEAHAVDPVADLRPVCPNCHAVLHVGGRCRTIEEVRQLLERQRQDLTLRAVPERQDLMPAGLTSRSECVTKRRGLLLFTDVL